MPRAGIEESRSEFVDGLNYCKRSPTLLAGDIQCLRQPAGGPWIGAQDLQRRQIFMLDRSADCVVGSDAGDERGEHDRFIESRGGRSTTSGGGGGGALAAALRWRAPGRHPAVSVRLGLPPA